MPLDESEMALETILKCQVVYPVIVEKKGPLKRKIWALEEEREI